MNARKVVTIILVLIALGFLTYAVYSTQGVRPVEPTPTPPVGDIGSGANQDQQREFDSCREQLEKRIKSEYQSECCWATAKEWVSWIALVITLSLIGFAYFTGQPAPPLPGGASPDAGGGNGSLKRTWASWAMMGLAFLATLLQAAEKKIESKENEKSKLVKRLRDTLTKARIAFGDAKTDKEYQAALDILRNAKVGIFPDDNQRSSP